MEYRTTVEDYPMNDDPNTNSATNTRPTGGKLGQLADRITGSGLYKFVKVFEAVAIIIAVVAFVIDYQQRREDRTFRAEERAALKQEREDRVEGRLVRMWSLATNSRPGNSGKIPALQFLHEKGHPLSGMEISRAYLVGIEIPGADLFKSNLSGADLRVVDLSDADLSEANLNGANFGGANLSGVDLFKADLSNANLSAANLSGAILKGTDLSGADISGADISGVAGLTQIQLDRACINVGYPPRKLLAGLKPPGRICPQRN